MTAIVANTADIRRAGNLGCTNYSTSDTTIRRNPRDASKTCSFRYPQHHHYHLISREGARTVVLRLPQNRCQARCAPNRAPRGLLLDEDSDSPSTKRQHEPGWRAPSQPVDISITPSQPFPLPLCNTKCKLHLRRASRARDDVRSFQPANINHTRAHAPTSARNSSRKHNTHENSLLRRERRPL